MTIGGCASNVLDMARSQESLWLWAGSTCITAGAALAGVAATLYAVRTNYLFWPSGPMVAAYTALSLGYFASLEQSVAGHLPLSRAASRGGNGRIEMQSRADSDTGNSTARSVGARVD